VYFGSGSAFVTNGIAILLIPKLPNFFRALKFQADALRINKSADFAGELCSASKLPSGYNAGTYYDWKSPGACHFIIFNRIS
jgi:hypothetical protein